MVEYEGDDVAAKDVAMHVAAMKPVSLSSADVPTALIDKERSIASQTACQVDNQNYRNNIKRTTSQYLTIGVRPRRSSGSSGQAGRSDLRRGRRTGSSARCSG